MKMTDQIIYRGIKVNTDKVKESLVYNNSYIYRGIPYLKTVRSTQPGNRLFLYRGVSWVG